MQEEINEKLLNLWEEYEQFMENNPPPKDNENGGYEEPWPRWPLLYSNSFEKIQKLSSLD